MKEVVLLKGRIYSILVLFLVFIASFASTFIFDTNESFKVESSAGLAVYYTSKILALLLIVVVSVFLYKTKEKSNLPFMIYVLAVLYQFLPLGIRFLSLGQNPQVVLPWMILFIVTICFVGLILAFEYVSSKATPENEVK